MPSPDPALRQAGSGFARMLKELRIMPNFKLSNIMNRYPGFPAILGALLIAVSTSTPAEEVTQQFNGLTLNANLEIADNTDITEGVVLIVHGLMGHSRMEIIEASQQALLDNGRSSLAINLSLGVDNRKGFFDCTWPHNYGQEDSLDEISAWVAWLRAKGVKEIVLMAHSRGSNESMVYTATRKDPEVTHLAMLAPGTDDSKERFEDRYGSTFDETLERIKKENNAGRGDELIENVDFWWCPKATVTPNTFLSFYDKESRFRNFKYYLPRIKIPTIIITASADERIPNSEKHVAPFVDGKRIQLVVIEGSGHFFLDFNIEEAMEAMLEFLADSE